MFGYYRQDSIDALGQRPHIIKDRDTGKIIGFEDWEGEVHILGGSFSSVLGYGADRRGTLDSYSSFNKAIKKGIPVYLPAGRYKLSDMPTLNNAQLIFGDGVTKSIIVIDTDFNLSALGVIRLGTSETGALITDIGFEFTQAAAAASGLRSDLVAYPPAIYAVGASRFEIGHIRIGGAYDGIDMTGNTGGAYIKRLELGCFNKNLELANALDFIHIESIHVWPFKFAATANLTSIYYDGETHAVLCGDCDGLSIDKLASFRAKVEFTSDNLGILPYSINSLQLDGDGARLIWNEGRGNISNMYSSKTNPTNTSLVVTGGHLNIGVASLSGAETKTLDVTGGRLQINGGEIYNNSLSKQGGTVSAGILELNNVSFNWAAGTRTTPMFEQSGTGVLRIQNCTPMILSPASELVKFNTDVAGNLITGQTLKPHTVTYPSTLTNGVYSSKVLSGDVSATFATPGDLSVVYGIRTVYWSYAHGFGRINYRLEITPTFTTSTGNLVLSLPGFPTSLTQASEIEITGPSGITLTEGRTSLMARISSTGEIILFEYSPTVALRQLSTANFTTGTKATVFFSGDFLL